LAAAGEREITFGNWFQKPRRRSGTGNPLSNVEPLIKFSEQRVLVNRQVAEHKSPQSGGVCGSWQVIEAGNDIGFKNETGRCKFWLTGCEWFERTDLGKTEEAYAQAVWFPTLRECEYA